MEVPGFPTSTAVSSTNFQSMLLSSSDFVRSHFTATEIAELGRHAVAHHNISQLSADNYQFVGSKVLKLAASVFAYASYPSGDTQKLTSLVASFVSGENLQPLLTRYRLERDASLHALLGFCARWLGVAKAAACLVPHFEATLVLSKEVLDIPQVISSLRPGTNLQGKSRSDRLRLISDELRLRGIDVREPREVEADEDFVPTLYEVDVLRRGGASESELEETVSFHTLQEANEYVLVRARRYIKECRSLENTVTARSDSDGVLDGGALVNVRRYLSLDEADPAQALAYGHFIMHTVKKILRFDSPFDAKLEAIGRLSHCIDSGGWVPLSDILDIVAEHHKSTCSIIEPPSVEFLSQLLEEHDTMQRFEIGVCLLETSPLHGIRCARALYAHQQQGHTDIPLYKVILDSWEKPTDCPSSGWLLCDRKAVKLFKTKGYKLYDNNVLLTVVQPQHIAMMQLYLQRGQLLPSESRFSQRCMLDEKIKSPIFFLEVFLGAAYHDNHMTVKQHPARGDIPGHHILVPHGHRYVKKAKGFEHRYFPLAFLSGRTIELRVDSEDGKAKVHYGRCEIPQDPMIVFSQEELESLLARGGAKKIEDDELLADRSSVLSHTSESQSLLSVEELLGAAATATEVTTLDDTSIRAQIAAFHQDEQVVLLEIEVPRSTMQVSFFERTKTVADLKKWITSLGIQYQEITSTKPGVERYLLRKAGQAFPEYVLDEIMSAIGVTFRNRALLRRAITRECQNKEDNYERLEFVGDAILDYVVAADAAVVIGDGCGGSIVQVAVDVCRNEVLCELLPWVLEAQLQAQYGDKQQVSKKTKADMFEAMVGAVYEDGLGLDSVRTMVSRLYANLPQAWERAKDDAEMRWKLHNALQLCPYTRPAGDLPPFNCDRILNCVSQEGGTGDAKQCGARTYQTWHSHRASTGFPRIQDKDYATHFTTGNVYSYRRLAAEQLHRLFQRVLCLHHDGDIGFVNETLRGVTKLTFDVDGVGIHSYGLVDIIGRWFASQFSDRHRDPRQTVPKSSSMGLILDCSGVSVVTKKIKRSCHVHFPQISVTLSRLGELTSSLRQFIVRDLAMNVRRGCYGTGRLVVVRANSSGACRRQQQTVGPVTVLLCRVVLDMNLLQSRLDGFNEALGAATAAGAPPAAVPLQGSFGVLQFLGLRDLLCCLSQVCKAFHRNVTEYLVLLSRSSVARFADCVYDGLVAATQQQQPLHNAQFHSAWRHSVSACYASLGNAMVLRCMSPPMESFANSVPLILPPDVSFEDVTSEKSLDAFVEQNSSKFTKPSMKSKEYFEAIIKGLSEKSVFDKSFWEKTIDHGLVESKKLRLYLNDKWDTVYNQEFRPLLMDSLVDVCSADSRRGSGGVRAIKCRHGGEGCPQLPHSTLLKLSTLHCPQWFDTLGRSIDVWDDSMFDHIQMSPLGDRTIAAAERETVARTTASSAPVVGFPATDVVLPSFEETRRHPPVVTTDWSLWLNGALSVSEVRGGSSSSGKVQRHAALMPSWWSFRYSADAGGRLGTATFIVAGQPYVTVTGTDLVRCLSETGGCGMEIVARILTPHIRVKSEWKQPSGCISTHDYFVTFCEPLRSAPKTGSISSGSLSSTAKLASSDFLFGAAVDAAGTTAAPPPPPTEQLLHPKPYTPTTSVHSPASPSAPAGALEAASYSQSTVLSGTKAFAITQQKYGHIMFALLAPRSIVVATTDTNELAERIYRWSLEQFHPGLRVYAVVVTNAAALASYRATLQEARRATWLRVLLVSQLALSKEQFAAYIVPDAEVPPDILCRLLDAVLASRGSKVLFLHNAPLEAVLAARSTLWNR